METVRCRGCGRIFIAVERSQHYCPECDRENEVKFREVREFLWNNPGSTSLDVMRECKVSEDLILQWLREERIAQSQISVDGITCRRLITKGTLCKDCQQKEAKQALRGLLTEPEKSRDAREIIDTDSHGMRFVGKRDK